MGGEGSGRQQRAITLTERLMMTATGEKGEGKGDRSRRRRGLGEGGRMAGQVQNPREKRVS